MPIIVIKKKKENSVVMTRVPCTKDSDATRVLNENYGLGLESTSRTLVQVG